MKPYERAIIEELMDKIRQDVCKSCPHLCDIDDGDGRICEYARLLGAAESIIKTAKKRR